MSNIRVLLVDDHMVVRVGLTALINAEPDMVVVGEASNGAEGLAATIAQRPDVVVMDINMPVMGGLEAARRIRALDRPDAKSIPIVALSANAYSDDVQRSINAGMQDHLAKPINVDELIRTMSRYIQ